MATVLGKNGLNREQTIVFAIAYFENCFKIRGPYMSNVTRFNSLTNQVFNRRKKTALEIVYPLLPQGILC